MVTTTQQLIDRLLRAYYNDYPSDESVLTNNEILLYINDAVASVMTKQTMEGYSVTGMLAVPDAYITTYKTSTYNKDASTGYYTFTLPHPPIGIPQNSSVLGCFFTGAKGQSKPVVFVSSNEVDYFRFMPSPPNSAYFWIEGKTLYLYITSTLPSGLTLNLRMATMKTDNLDEPINIPPEAVDQVFTMVFAKLAQRKSIHSDNIIDTKE